MVIKVGINGFGRIGRVVSRVCLENRDLQLLAINDPAISVEYVCYLLKFDSTHGKLKGRISHTRDEVIVDEHRIKIFHEKSPQCVPWHTADVQYVVEASGMFTNLEKASGHFASEGIKRVIIAAPSVDVPMIILGVNENKLRIDQKVLSCASSTLYCLAPIIKVLEDNFGVVEGFITSIHAMTPSLKPLDGLCLRGKHWRDHRSIHQNIIPATTGACKALGKIIPQVKDKLSGLAFRVPIVNVSVLDLTVRLNSGTTLAEIVKCIQKASKDSLRNIIKISNEESVSSDFIGESHSCIFDEDSSIQLKPNFFKIICWYENEYSYACRVVDSIIFSEKQFNNSTKLKVNKSLLLRKQDETQQTECYKREVSVSCCDNNITEMISKVSCISSKEKENKVTSRQFMKPATETDSLQSYKRNEVFKIWKDSSVISKPIVKKNTSSFFQSCISIETPIAKEILNKKAHTRLESVKSEFSKMVNLTEDLLKKTDSNQSDVPSSSKNDLRNKSDNHFRSMDTFFMVDAERSEKDQKKYTIENCGDCKSVIQNSKEPSQALNDSSNEEEISLYSFDKEVSDLNISEAKNIHKENSLKATNKNSPKEYFNNKTEEETSILETFDEKNAAIGKEHNDFKEHLSKTISILIEGLSKSMQNSKNRKANVMKEKENELTKAKCKHIELSEDNYTDGCKNQIVCKKHVHEITKTEQLSSDSVLNLNAKIDLIENYKINKDATNVKLIDKELRKRNIVLVDSPFLAETLSDDNFCMNDISVVNVEHKKKNINQKILEGLSLNPENVFICSEDNSRCDSPENTNTTLSNRNENKQDIYDKLDSASDSDSINSCEIKERKSQVIHLTDLTNSFEDLARLDKICRIIEISDELSDSLFSALDNKDFPEIKNKRWSFKDLCERIQLDEFCNKVFGKTTPQISD